jgi:ATP-dependent helicase/nuclease subunit A
VPLTGLVAAPDGTSRIVAGQLDRLVVTDAAVIVVDYKTNRPPPDTAAAVPDIYLRQMAAYRTLLRAIYPGRDVRCCLLWTDGPRLMPLRDADLDRFAPTGAG